MDFNIIIGSIFLLMVLTLIVAIRYGRENRWLWLGIPLTIMLTLSTYQTVNNLLGYPTVETESHEQLYISHIIGVNEEWIYVWVIDTDIKYVPRAYVIPYTKEDEKKLAEAKARQGDGFPQGIQLPPATSGNRKTSEVLKLYNFDKMKGITKNG